MREGVGQRGDEDSCGGSRVHVLGQLWEFREGCGIESGVGGQGMAVQLGRACKVFGTAILLARGTCMVACVAAAVKVIAVCSVSGEARGSEETGTLEAVTAANGIATGRGGSCAQWA